MEVKRRLKRKKRNRRKRGKWRKILFMKYFLSPALTRGAMFTEA